MPDPKRIIPQNGEHETSYDFFPKTIDLADATSSTDPHNIVTGGTGTTSLTLAGGLAADYSNVATTGAPIAFDKAALYRGPAYAVDGTRFTGADVYQAHIIFRIIEAISGLNSGATWWTGLIDSTGYGFGIGLFYNGTGKRLCRAFAIYDNAGTMTYTAGVEGSPDALSVRVDGTCQFVFDKAPYTVSSTGIDAGGDPTRNQGTILSTGLEIGDMTGDLDWIVGVGRDTTAGAVTIGATCQYRLVPAAPV